MSKKYDSVAVSWFEVKNKTKMFNLTLSSDRKAISIPTVAKII